MLKHVGTYAVVVFALVAFGMHALGQVQPGTAEVRISARQLVDGRVEFALQEKEGALWSSPILPRSRFFPADAPIDRWLHSSAILLNATGSTQSEEVSEAALVQAALPAITAFSEMTCEAEVDAFGALALELASRPSLSHWTKADAQELLRRSDMAVGCFEEIQLEWRALLEEYPVIGYSSLFEKARQDQEKIATEIVTYRAEEAGWRAILVAIGLLDE